MLNYMIISLDQQKTGGSESLFPLLLVFDMLNQVVNPCSKELNKLKNVIRLVSKNKRLVP